MAIIKNKRYREFLDKGSIKTLNEEDIVKALKRIQGRNLKQSRSLLIALYYTGARPVEILQLRSKDVKKEKNYIIVQTPASKNGLPRPIYLPYKHLLIKEFWKYCSGVFSDMLLFHSFIGKYKRKYKTKTGKIIEYIETTNKLRYHFNKWFDYEVTPYLLRHNRFSKLMENGADAEEIRLLKGAKTYGSVTPYLHMSTKSAKKIGRKIN